MESSKTGSADDVHTKGSPACTPPNYPQLSTKLREKLEKLAPWRVDPSRIEFLNDGPDIEGGFAVIRRASLLEKDIGLDGYAEGTEGAIDQRVESSDVAVKMLKTRSGDDIHRVLKRAIREADILANLHHPHIVTLKGFVEDVANGDVRLIFPWAGLGNMRDFIASEDWSVPERIWMIDDVVRGVEYIHAQNPPICHGDLKSINILVNSNGQAVLTDFGSARRLKEVPHDSEKAPKLTAEEAKFSAEYCPTSNTLTFTGTEYTLRWVAPEVLCEDDVGTAADIWSMGWVFYEIMTGSIPFENLKKSTAIILHISQGKLPALEDDDRMSPVLALVSLMVMCWQVDPEGRPSAARCRGYINQLPACAPRSKRSPNTALETAERLLREGDMYRLQDDHDKALAVLHNALDVLGEELASTTPEGIRVLFAIADIHRVRDEYEDAVALYDRVARICEKTGDRAGRANAQWGLAEVHRLRNELDEAVALYTVAVRTYDEVGDRAGKADAQWGLAEVHRLRGEYDEAVALYSEVIQIREQIGDRGGKASAQLGLAGIHVLRNEYDEAVALYSEVVQICEQIGDRRGRADAQWGLAGVYRNQKEYAQSIRLFTESAQVYRAYGSIAPLASVLRGLADTHCDQGHYDDAIECYEEAAQHFSDVGLVGNASEVLECIAEIRRTLAAIPETDP